MMIVMTFYEVIATVVAGLGLVGGAVGFFRSRSADARSRAASAQASRAAEDAALALTRSATANEESASALKRMNELTEARIPQPKISFRSTHVAGDIYSLLCTGLPVSQVVVAATGRVMPIEEAPKDMKEGDSLRFAVARMNTEDVAAPRLHIDYTDPETGKRHASESDLNL